MAKPEIRMTKEIRSTKTEPRPDGSLARMLDLPGERAQVRVRATVTALHLLRALLTGSRDEGA